MDAIDRVVMNARLHHLGMASRTAQPSLKLAVLTCMDARVDPAALLGLHPGDAHVIRNAGGRATNDALHALAISQAVLGTREVLVMHHTECAMGRMSGADLAARITAATNHPFHEELSTFTDDATAIAEDVAHIRMYPSLAFRDKVRGFLYDLTAETLREVVPLG
ncbi:MAG TPA: carbonic anhydrase [Gaiellales bacterium]|nr:carbonic anhydrase [Gaiellales bacterium]